jgi:hypothetical protein
MAICRHITLSLLPFSSIYTPVLTNLIYSVSLLEISARPALENVADMGLLLTQITLDVIACKRAKEVHARAPPPPLSDFTPKLVRTQHTRYENAFHEKCIMYGFI